MRLIESGDVQLWVISGDGWKFPVYAKLFSDKSGNRYYTVKPATPLTASQFEVVDSRLGPESVSPYDSYWVLSEEAMASLGSIAPGITPTRYVEWDGAAADSSQVSINVKPGDAKGFNTAFLKYIHGKYGFTKSLSQLKFMWVAICGEMSKWMYEKQGAVDFGFARMVALPLRQNWKAILLAKFPKIVGLFRRSKGKARAQLAISGFPIEMRRTDLIEFDLDNGGTVGWNLEVIPDKSWIDYVKESERAITATSGSGQYGSAWKRRVDKAEEDILDSFQHYAISVAQPCAGVPEGGPFGGSRLVPFVPKGKVRPVADSPGDECVSRPDDQTDVRQPSSISTIVVEEDGGMQEVRVIRFGKSNVRDNRSDMAEREGG